MHESFGLSFVAFSEIFLWVLTTASFDISVRPHGKTRLPMDGLSWNLVFPYFSKVCVQNLSFIKIWQEQRVLYMKTCIFTIIPLWILLRMRNIWGKSCRENQNTHFMFNNFFPDNRTVYEVMWKNTVQPVYGRQYNTAHAHCMLDK
jgi:hypothetical protein